MSEGSIPPGAAKLGHMQLLREAQSHLYAAAAAAQGAGRGCRVTMRWR